MEKGMVYPIFLLSFTYTYILYNKFQLSQFIMYDYRTTIYSCKTTLKNQFIGIISNWIKTHNFKTYF